MIAWPPCIEGIGATAAPLMPSASIDSKGYMHQKAMAQWDRRGEKGGGPKAARNSPQVAAVIVIFERFRTCRLPMPEEDDKKIGQRKVEASKGPK